MWELKQEQNKILRGAEKEQKSIFKDVKTKEKEAEEQAKAQALAFAQEQLERAGEQEQKGEGRRKAYKKQGGKKAQSIDSEHKARLKALFN